MRASAPTVCVVIMVTAGLVGACTNGRPDGASGFERTYRQSRESLEQGDYERAISGYRELLPAAGPAELRIRLEIAHALLRANRFDEAAAEADMLSRQAEGQLRGAALAVRGTADHEVARQAIASGRPTGAVRSRLDRAAAALAEVADRYPEQDPSGAMAGRLQEVRATLDRIG